MCLLTIEIAPGSEVAELARQQRTKHALASFRERAGGGPRMDAVMYLLGAIEKFETIDRPKVQQIGFEIAILSQRGLDMNDSAQKHELRSLPGKYSGLHLVCLMYAAYKVLDPKLDAGIDLLETYVSWRPQSNGVLRWNVRAGAFFPPVSLENDDLGWTSPYTLTPSAINSWVGSELRTIGGEGT